MKIEVRKVAEETWEIEVNSGVAQYVYTSDFGELLYVRADDAPEPVGEYPTLDDAVSAVTAEWRS